MDESVIPCDEIIEDTVPVSFNKKLQPVKKKKKLYILLAFLLITIALLIAISIYCYVILYKAKQKHLLQFNFTNYKLKIYTKNK